MRKAIFYLLNIVLFPVTLLGYLLWIGKGVLRGNRSGVSVTAQGPLFARWFMHKLGVRRDAAAARLLPMLPGVPHLGLQCVAGPMLLAHRLTGYVPKVFRYPYAGEIAVQDEPSARQTFFDSAVERNRAAVTQLVVLGAGFDTRVYRLPGDMPIRAFEVDRPQTQARKRTLLTQAGVDAAGVTFVAADFERDDWLAKLSAAGFDTGAPALFLWEGVTMYLDRAAVAATLRNIAGTAAGSMVVFDYFTTEVFTSKALYWRYARRMANAVGEPWKFGIDSTPPSRERLAEFLRACGLALHEQRTLGDETHGKRAWGGFAIAIVQKEETHG